MGDGAAPAVEVSAGYVHSCARLADNSLHCWGDNAFGELGLGEVPPSNGAYGTVVAPSTPLVQVSVGARDTCAVANDGTVYCWGLNTQGQLAHASDAMALTQPTQVPGLTGVAEVQLGGNWACARLLDGGVDCWGNNVGAGYHCDSGALCTPIPTPIHGLGGLDGGAAHLAVGPLAACAIMADTSVRCWGYNSDNELGNGSSQSGLAATTVVYVTSFLPLVDVVDLGMGSAGTCAVLVDGGVACWGTTAFGGGAEAALVTMAPAVQVSLNTYEIQSSGFAGCVKRTDGGVS
jgi:alpha-tubulin suppressor-like RCC1 family protein